MGWEVRSTFPKFFSKTFVKTLPMSKDKSAKKSKSKKDSSGSKNGTKPPKTSKDEFKEGNDVVSLEFSDDESGTETLKINKDYAKRFEHNKNREDFDRLKEKYGSDLDDEDSPSEDEDDIGDLVTEEIDEGIEKVIEAIRKGDEKLKDPTVKFFPDLNAAPKSKAKKEKPMFLKDYHRENLLAEDDNNGERMQVDESYNDTQARQKAEFFAAMDDDEDGEDDFLTKRTEERKIEEAPLPDPEKDEEGFLKAFLSNKGWVPKDVDETTGDKKVPTYGEIVDEDSDEFDDLADKFETAYNFRFEDPEAAEIVSYARDQSTLRRKDDSSRRRARDKKRAQREAEESQRKLELARLRKHKVNEVTDKLERLASILGDAELSEKFTQEDLEGEWDDDEWDKRMKKLFDDEFYSKQDDDWAPEVAGGKDGAENEDQNDANYEAPEVSEEIPEEISKEVPEKKSKKKAKQEALEMAAAKPIADMSKKELKRKAKEIVDANTDLLLDETFKPSAEFRYREVEPESFGLTARDILLADDKELNQYVGLKHLAPYRDADRVSKDRKRYAKKRRLREWRQQAFGAEEVNTDELWENLKKETAVAPEPSKKRRKQKKK